ncbi:MAG: hypothetical protein WDO69_23840 [Pseudomonadota bacterium]
MEAWSAATDGVAALVPSVGEAPPGALLTIEPAALEGTVLGNTDGTAMHAVNWAAVQVDVDKVRSASSEHGSDPAVVLQTVVEHELGHALGVPHLAGGLMLAHWWPDDTTVDDAAVGAFLEGRAE